MTKTTDLFLELLNEINSCFTTNSVDTDKLVNLLKPYTPSDFNLVSLKKIFEKHLQTFLENKDKFPSINLQSTVVAGLMASICVGSNFRQFDFPYVLVILAISSYLNEINVDNIKKAYENFKDFIVQQFINNLGLNKQVVIVAPVLFTLFVIPLYHKKLGEDVVNVLDGSETSVNDVVRKLFLIIPRSSDYDWFDKDMTVYITPSVENSILALMITSLCKNNNILVCDNLNKLAKEFLLLFDYNECSMD